MSIYAPNAGNGVALNFTRGQEMRVTINQPLVIDLSSGTQIGYSIGYFTE
jgi:hypothetical protein